MHLPIALSAFALLADVGTTVASIRAVAQTDSASEQNDARERPSEALSLLSLKNSNISSPKSLLRMRERGLTSLSWERKGQDIHGETEFDESGYEVSLSGDGNILAVGAPYNDDNPYESGHVRVFQFIDGLWSQMGEDIDGEASGDYSGRSVSLSHNGHILAVGASHNDGNGDGAGHVRVFEFVGGSWSQMGEDIDGEYPRDWSGESVSLSDNGLIVAIGAQGNDDTDINSGHVRVYEFADGAWSQMGDDIDGEQRGTASGRSVSLSSNGLILAIGAYNIFYDGYGTRPTGKGSVRVFKFSNGAWSQMGDNINGGDWFDYAYYVSLSGDGQILAIAARGDDTNGRNVGAARVYEFTDGSWTLMGDPVYGEEEFDFYGSSVSLSDSGHTLAVGSFGNDANGESSGHVRVFEFVDGSWSKLGDDIDGLTAEDKSGRSISLSGDGKLVAIGAPGNNQNGRDSGVVRVMSYGDSDSILEIIDNKLSACEGHCTKDSQCQNGLSCYKRSGIEAVPGCAGYGISGQNYCSNRPPDYLFFVGSNRPAGSLGPCEGKCTADADCQEGLVCHPRIRFDPVPGCDGTGRKNHGYCIHPGGIAPSR